MWRLIVFSALLAAAAAAPAGGWHDSQDAEILKNENHNQGEDGYRYSFETSDGTSKTEAAEIIDKGYDSEALVVSGSYTYVDNDGVEYTVEYTAGPMGFVPKGKHLPKIYIPDTKKT